MHGSVPDQEPGPAPLAEVALRPDPVGVEPVRARTARLDQVDIARGLAVIGVVLNHAVDGLIGASLVAPTSALAHFNDALYVFRMPTLALLLGLFIPLSVRRRGLGPYLRQRVVLFGYLYVVWFFLQSAVEALTSGLRNSQSHPLSLLTIWNPPAHLWFIPFLVIASVVVGCLAPWRRGFVGWLGVLALGAASVLTWGWNPSFIGLRGLSLLFFVALGATIQVTGLNRAFQMPVRVWLVVGPLAVGAFYGLWRTGLAPATQEAQLSAPVVLRSVLAAGVGIVIVLGLAVLLASWGPARGALSAVGRRTLPIYLAHVMVVAGGRIVLDKLLHVEHVWIYPTVLVPAGVVVPLLLSLYARRLHLAWLFQLPARLAARTGTP